METVSRKQVEDQLRDLPSDQLAAASRLLAMLAQTGQPDDGLRDMLSIAESSLRPDWDTPEEDAAWAHLADLPTW